MTIDILLAPLPAMLLVIGSWLLIAIALIGLGLLLSRLLSRSPAGVCSPLMAFWLGLAVVLALSQVWHLFFAVTWLLPILFFIAGLAGLFVARRDVQAALARSLERRHLWLILILVGGALLWQANRAIGPPNVFDTGLYHLQALRWNQAAPIVPGLGNLHPRLAFNSSYLVYAAVIDSITLLPEGHHLASGLLLAALLSMSMHSLYRIVTRQVEGSALPDYFMLMMLPLLLDIGVSREASSYDPNTGAFALSAIAFWALIHLLAHGESDISRSFILIMAVSGLTIKLSTAALLGTMAALVVIDWLPADGIKHPPRKLKMVLSLCAGIGLVWMLRSVISSGYPLFPSSIGGLPVAWRVPHDLIQDTARSIRSWARLPGQPPEVVLGSIDWLGPWWTTLISNGTLDVVLPLIVAVVSGIAALILFGLKRDSTRIDRLWIAVALGLLYWFITAPDRRFANGIFWMAASAGMLSLLVRLSWRGGWKAVLVGAVALAGLVFIIEDAYYGWVNRGPGIGFYPVKEVEVEAVVTDWGLTVYRPVDSSGRCWDAPLPCTPSVDRQLRYTSVLLGREGFVLLPPGR